MKWNDFWIGWLCACFAMPIAWLILDIIFKFYVLYGILIKQ
jgi:hypothetical protein